MQEFNEDLRFLAEHIGKGFLGREVLPSTKFSEYAIAKVKRFSGRVNFVAVKYDPKMNYRVTYDPQLRTGMIAEFMALYIYDESKPAPTDPVFLERPIVDMNMEDLRVEMTTIHGISEPEVKEYKNLINRRTKVTELREKFKKK